MRVLSTGLLMGAAASLAMTSGAGAADLPVKAKAPAVEYVKICSLYGAGFYYIPGTDTCLKIGGHLRVDAHWGASGGVTESVDYNANWDRADQRLFNTRTRAYATFDARSQTAYGTLRSYFLIGATYDGVGDGDTGPDTNVYMIRAFIQLAGFTWGLTTSIFDAYSITPFHLDYVAATNGSIGASGIWQWRYTAQFGNGFSASIAVEEPRRRIKSIIDGGAAAVAIGASPPITSHVGAEWPDVIGQLQASGPWGRAQVAVAVKDASAVDPFNPLGTSSVDEIGWAAMVGGFLRVPGLQGDTFGFQFTYAEGATAYVTGNANTVAGRYTTSDGFVDSIGFVTDGVVTAPGTMSLTTAWGFEVGYEHLWTPTLRTSLAGGYVQIEHDAPAAAAICAVMATSGPGCNPDTSFWNIGSRTRWSPVPNFSLALSVLYTHIDSATYGAGAGGPRNAAVGDADIWTGLVRVRRDFWP
jgi:hypothetical protein